MPRRIYALTVRLIDTTVAKACADLCEHVPRAVMTTRPALYSLMLKENLPLRSAGTTAVSTVRQLREWSRLEGDGHTDPLPYLRPVNSQVDTHPNGLVRPVEIRRQSSDVDGRSTDVGLRMHVHNPRTLSRTG